MATIRDQVHDFFGDTIREIIAPMRDAWHDIEDATAELEDDAALGRRTREVARAYATRVIDRALVGDSEAGS